ncbi:MAG: hypothetical protein QM696_12065 [Steroidobacteraceae bacterium]
MTNPVPRLVVRTYAPLRRYLIIGGSVLIAAVALYAAFEWGRLNAGYDSRAARAQIGELHDQVRKLEADNRRQRLQLASQETERAGQTRERAELSKAIGDLQAEVGRQAQDLAFYRGVVGESLQADVVRIQQFRVTRGAQPGEYLLKLVLGRPLRPDDVVSGTVKMTFEGTTAATPVNLDLAAVSDVTDGTLDFSYRYIETLEQAIRLPAGFQPARTTIELQPARKGANPVRQTFLWTVETA